MIPLFRTLLKMLQFKLKLKSLGMVGPKTFMAVFPLPYHGLYEGRFITRHWLSVANKHI
jgi:hypothetical protein